MAEKRNIPLVDVFTGQPWEVNSMKELLESKGITAVAKEKIIGEFDSDPVAVISLQVKEKDYESAVAAICKIKKDQ